jgi:hypothetical protein
MLYEMQGLFRRNYSIRAVLVSELEGKRRGDAESVYTDRGRVTRTSAKGRVRFSGKWVRVPIELSPIQGTGTVAEAGTINTPHVLNTTEAHILMARIVHPISISLDAQYASKDNFANNGDAAEVADAVSFRMQGAERIMPRVFNEMLWGNGDALLAAFTAGATSATQTVGTSANFYQLYNGRIVDALTRATGVPVASGQGRTIVSTNPAAGTVTFDASVIVTTAEGIYIEGSYGTATQGLGQALATTGQFEAIDKSLQPGWLAVDGRGGDTTVQDLNQAMLDGAERRVGNNGDGPDFYLGDIAAIDRFGQTLISQSQWAGDAGELKTGWKGITYRDKVLVGDRDAKTGRVVGIDIDSITLYSYTDGPSWIDDTGSMFMRFSRKLPKEAWLADFVQPAWSRTNTSVYLDNLALAA